MALDSPLQEQEAIRQVLVRLRRESSQDLGVPLVKLVQFLEIHFKMSPMEHISDMVRRGVLIAARPAHRPDLRSRPSMVRPEILSEVSLEGAGSKYPIIYLSHSSNLPRPLLRLINRREELNKIAREVAAGVHVPLKGGDNVVPLANAKKRV